MKRLLLLMLGCLIVMTAQAQEDDRKKGRKLPATPPVAQPAQPAAPQPALLHGLLIDQSTGESLMEVTLRLEGTDKITRADIDGQFRFDQLPPGTYVLTGSLIGYENLRVENIKLASGQTLKLTLAMKSEDVQLETVVISSAVEQQTELASISQQRSATVIMDGFSGDMILKQTPGFQLALALQRMPGVAMIEDRLLSIRGLYERYTNLTVNEAILPYSDFERAGFDYSLIPAKLVSSIAVMKSGRSDLTSEFAGGLIQLQTTDIPDKNSAGVSLQWYYNDLSSFRSFRGYPQGNEGWKPWGKVPDNNSSLPSTRDLAALPTGSAERYDAVRNYNPQYDPTTYTAPLGLNAVFNVQRRFKVAGKEAGLTGAVSFLDHYTTENQYVNILETYDEELGRCPVGDTSKGVLDRRTQNLTAMLNGGIKLRNGKITMHNMFLANRGSFYLDTKGFVMDTENDAISQVYNFPTMRMTQSTLWSSQLNGKHRQQLTTKKHLNWEWDANASRLSVTEPGYRAITFTPGDTLDWVLTPVATRADSASPYELSPYDASLVSQSNTATFGGRAAATYPVNQNVGIKAGIFTYHRYRKFRSRLLGPAFLTDADDVEITDLTEAQRALGLGRQLLAPEHYRANGYEFFELTSAMHNYDARRSTWAGYVMPQWTVSSRVFLQAGLRAEYFSQQIDTLSAVVDGSGVLLSNQLTDLLPAFNVTYYLTDRMNLRFAYSQTLIRPNEREQVPLPFLDFVIGSMTIGNDKLLRTKVHNIDLKWEHYGENDQLLSANLFYKFFHLPIEQVFVSGEALNFATAVQNYQTFNSDRAQAAGIELEARWSPGSTFNVDVLRNLRTYANLTLQRSRVGEASVFDLLEKGGRSLQGQANYVINLGAIYATEESGWSAGVFYNRGGQRIAYVGAGDYVFPSIWELPRNVLDIQLGKQIGKLGLRLTLNDILNEPFRFVQIYDGRTRYEEGKDQVQKFAQRNFRLFFTVSYDF